MKNLFRLAVLQTTAARHGRLRVYRFAADAQLKDQVMSVPASLRGAGFDRLAALGGDGL